MDNQDKCDLVSVIDFDRCSFVLEHFFSFEDCDLGAITRCLLGVMRLLVNVEENWS